MVNARSGVIAADAVDVAADAVSAAPKVARKAVVRAARVVADAVGAASAPTMRQMPARRARPVDRAPKAAVNDQNAAMPALNLAESRLPRPAKAAAEVAVAVVETDRNAMHALPPPATRQPPMNCPWPQRPSSIRSLAWPHPEPTAPKARKPVKVDAAADVVDAVGAIAMQHVLTNPKARSLPNPWPRQTQKPRWPTVTNRRQPARATHPTAPRVKAAAAAVVDATAAIGAIATRSGPMVSPLRAMPQAPKPQRMATPTCRRASPTRLLHRWPRPTMQPPRQPYPTPCPPPRPRPAPGSPSRHRNPW